MKNTLKIIATIVLFISSLYFGVSLFFNQLIEVDVVDTVVQSEVVEETILNSLGDFQDVVGADDNTWEQFMTILQNDDTFNDMAKTYIQTLLNDMLNGENTFDDQEIKTKLLSLTDVVYELSQPQMTKEEFRTKYEDMINRVNMNTLHDKAIEKIQTKVPSSTLKPVTTVYQMAQMPFVYVSLALMIVALGYLIFVSYQEKAVSKGISVTYLISGLLMFVLAVVIVFVLSSMASASTSFQISSIRYMYLCGGIYLAISLIAFIINDVLKRKRYVF